MFKCQMEGRWIRLSHVSALQYFDRHAKEKTWEVEAMMMGGELATIGRFDTEREAEDYVKELASIIDLKERSKR